MLDSIKRYFEEVKEICDKIDYESVKHLADILLNLRGRCFIVGVGGSAANCSHLVNDLRKIGGIDAMTPLDNVSELTARINDASWQVSISDSLRVSRISSEDCLFVLSVGGGSSTTSANLVRAMQEAKDVGAKVVSIVSRDGGYAKQCSEACVLIPVVNEDMITPHAEEFQGVVWHLVTSILAGANK